MVGAAITGLHAPPICMNQTPLAGSADVLTAWRAPIYLYALLKQYNMGPCRCQAVGVSLFRHTGFSAHVPPRGAVSA